MGGSERERGGGERDKCQKTAHTIAKETYWRIKRDLLQMTLARIAYLLQASRV
jgi:hypothetical protein